MNYYSVLNQFNSIEGVVVDTAFTTFNSAVEFINLVNSSAISSRNYYVIKSFDSSPWQPAYDFSNEVKNKLKKKSKLIKEDLNEKHLKELKNIAVGVVDFDYITPDMLKVLYSYVKIGGVIVVKTSSNVSGALKVLSELFTRKQIVVYDNFLLINRIKPSSLGKVKRTKSLLT